MFSEYKILLKFDGDKDIAFKSEYENPCGFSEREHWTNARGVASRIVKEMYHEVASTIYCGEVTEDDLTNPYSDYAKVQLIKDFEQYLHKLLDKYETIHIEFMLGNPTFEISIIKDNIEEHEDYQTVVPANNSTVWLRIDNEFENAINWKVVDSLHDGEWV